jgi:hypothetical protein
MNQNILLIILTILCFACEHSSKENANSQKDSVQKEIDVTHKINNSNTLSYQLVRFKQSTCIHNSLDTLEEDDHFSKESLTTDKQLIHDTLIIHAVRLANCGTKLIGSIEMRNDTLFLYYKIRGTITKNKNGKIDTIVYSPVSCICRYCLTFYVANVKNMPRNIEVKYKML